MRIIAHRGASGYAPENTLAAFKKAIEMGAKEIEFDVQLTKDGQLVVIHDYYLNRTTNGKGMIMNTDYTYIKTLDAGSWFSESFSDEKVPLLSEVITLCKEANDVDRMKNGTEATPICLHIEIKKTKLEQRPIERFVLELVKASYPKENVVFSSFHHQCLQSLLAMESVKCGVLLGSELLAPIKYLEHHHVKSYSLNQSAEFIDNAFIREAHENGLQVLSYTVNSKDIALYFDSLGVDGIFSNYPDLLK